MNRIVIKIGLALLLAGVSLFHVTAQPADKNLYDFDLIKHSNGWLTSNNASLLGLLPVSGTSVVQASFGKDNGEFINYHQSNDSYNAGAHTESFSRIGEKVAVYGKLLYNNFRGENMGGSVLIDPYFSSFNIVEMADTTRGRKSQECYNLVGGIGVELSSKLHLGAKIDYSAINYAKAKDLRHTNLMLDMILTAGLSYKLGDLFTMGANYLYHRNVESLYFKIYGTTDKMYHSLIDFGAFYGQREQSGEKGYSQLTDRKPLVSVLNGASLQLDFAFTPEISFFNEFSYRNRSGYYGAKALNSITYIEDSGMELDYSGHFSINKGENLHIVKLFASYKQLANNENIFQEKYQSGKTTIEYFGQNKVLDRMTVTGNLEYSANIGVKNYRPTWTITAGADAFYRDITTSIYPFYRKQDILSVNGYVSGGYNIIKNKGIMGFRLGAAYGTGGGNMFSDGTYAQPSANAKVPKTAEYALQREFEYLTADRINANAGLRYSRFFKKGITGYADLTYSYINALSVTYLKGNMHHSLNLSVGLTF